MVQTGDPLGTGKGGTSIWGRKFEDEFHETLKVSQSITSTYDNGASDLFNFRPSFTVQGQN